MAEPIAAQLRRPVPLILLALAALGWILFIATLVARTNEVADAEERIQAVTVERDEVAARLVTLEDSAGTAEALRTEIADAGTQAEVARAELLALSEANTAVLAEAAAAEDEAAEIAQRLTAARDELAAVAAERDAAVAEAEAARAEAADLEIRAGTLAEDLAAVGARIEEARTAESELLSANAELSQTNADMAELAAETEAGLQSLRAEEATLVTQRDDLEADVAEAQVEAGRAEEVLGELEARLSAVTEDVRTAEEQRAALQENVTELANALAARGADLSDLEGRIAALQDRGAALALPAAAGDVAGAPFAPGRYVAGEIEATFSEDGSFEMRTQAGREVRGRYETTVDRLDLLEAAGSIGSERFPMRCGLDAAGEGFVLRETEGSCRVLDGLRFEPAK